MKNNKLFIAISILSSLFTFQFASAFSLICNKDHIYPENHPKIQRIVFSDDWKEASYLEVTAYSKRPLQWKKTICDGNRIAHKDCEGCTFRLFCGTQGDLWDVELDKIERFSRIFTMHHGTTNIYYEMRYRGLTVGDGSSSYTCYEEPEMLHSQS